MVTIKKVLFVCIHNTCRSIIAEVIFNSLSKNWIAESAGAKPANEVDKTVVKMLVERGYPKEGIKKKPSTLNKVKLEDYDLIVTTCKDSCPFIPVKGKQVHWDVENPAGKAEGVYEKVFVEIEKKVKELVSEID